MKIILSILFVFIFAFAAFGQSNCPVTLSSYSASVSAFYLPNRIIPIDITAASNCAWSSASNSYWISFSVNDQAVPIMQTISGSGNARIYVFVAENRDDSRTGGFMINNQTFTIAQGNDCSYSLGDQSPHGFSDAGGSFFLPRARNGGFVTYCTVTYTTNAAWIHIGATNYTVDANFGAARSATILLNYADKPALVYTVNQAAGTPAPTPTPTPTPTCTFQLGATSQTFTYTGGSGLIDIITQNGCAYTATNNDSFVTLQNAGGTGNGTINFDVAANSSGAARAATITIAGQIFTVNQSGAAKTRKRIRMF